MSMDFEISVSLSGIMKADKQIVIYAILLKYMNNENYSCYPSISTLMKDTGLDKQRVLRDIEKLVSKKLVSRISRGSNYRQKTNHYKILNPHHKTWSGGGIKSDTIKSDTIKSDGIKSDGIKSDTEVVSKVISSSITFNTLTNNNRTNNKGTNNNSIYKENEIDFLKTNLINNIEEKKEKNVAPKKRNESYFYELENSTVWIESVSMSNQIDPEQTKEFLVKFEKHLFNSGDEKLNIRDVKSHFTNWLPIQLKKLSQTKKGQPPELMSVAEAMKLIQNQESNDTF